MDITVHCLSSTFDKNTSNLIRSEIVRTVRRGPVVLVIGLFGLAIVREVLPEARDQWHVSEAISRRLSCLLRAHQIDRPGLAPGILHLEAGLWPRYHMMSWSGSRRLMPESSHRNTIVDRRALFLAFLHIRILFETDLIEIDNSHLIRKFVFRSMFYYY